MTDTLTLARDPDLPGVVAINDRGNTIVVLEYHLASDGWSVIAMRPVERRIVSDAEMGPAAGALQAACAEERR